MRYAKAKGLSELRPGTRHLQQYCVHTSAPYYWMEASVAMSEKGQREKRAKRKRKQLYSKADKNALIDAVAHPLAKEYWAFVIVTECSTL